MSDVRLIDANDLEKMVSETTWYHINKNGELVESAEDRSSALYRAEDIYRLIYNAPTVETEQEKLVIIRAKIKLDNVALQFYRDKFKKEFEEGLIFLPEYFEATVHDVIHDVKIEGGQT